MIDFNCDKCKSKVVLNEVITIKAYVDILNYEAINTGELVSNTLPSFLYYQCIECGEKYKLDFKEFELRVRKSMVEKAVKLKNINLRSQINPYSIDPDNGITECGMCDGIDGKGICFTDYFKQCPIRKLKNA